MPLPAINEFLSASGTALSTADATENDFPPVTFGTFQLLATGTAIIAEAPLSRQGIAWT